MPKSILFILSCLWSIVFPVCAGAQMVPAAQKSIYFYNENSIVISSDSTTRSALLCNLLADKSGAYSPLIGTGNWDDNGKNVQISSLLYFDLSPIATISQNDIIKAWLLMVPVSAGVDLFDPSTARIRIRRVAEPWDDSTTNWSNQPAISNENGYKYLLGRPDTNNYYKFNVTRLVREMKRSGNFGFEINYNGKENSQAFGRLYYSPRVTESDLRPMLIIQIADQVVNEYYFSRDKNIQPDNFSTFNRNMPMYDRSQLIEYMKEPVVRPTNPPPPPPPPPVKSDN
jgi:hypothetical protein